MNAKTLGEIKWRFEPVETAIWDVVVIMVLKCPDYPLASAGIQPACHIGKLRVCFAGLFQKCHAQDNRHSPRPLRGSQCISHPAALSTSALMPCTAPSIWIWPTVDMKDIVFALFPSLIQFSKSHRWLHTTFRFPSDWWAYLFPTNTY